MTARAPGNPAPPLLPREGGSPGSGGPALEDETPLMRQWREIKSRHPDALLFFRVGDFFELFYGDAQEGARLLGLTLTSRNNGAAAEVPMAGVPAKALDDYLARLVRIGRRAAICDQVQDPAEAKGIVRREVVETVTPGTVLHDNLLQAHRNTFLVALTPERGGWVGLAASDLSTGELTLQRVEAGSLTAELGRLGPAELLLPRSFEDEPPAQLAEEGGGTSGTRSYRDDWIFDEAAAAEELKRRYGTLSLDGLGFQATDGLLVQAAGALAQYVREIQPRGSAHLQPPRIRRPGDEMALDEMTRRNLELVEPLRAGEEGGTLIAVLDDAVTPMGGRLLRQWVLRPLVVAEAIWRRQAGVEELLRERELRTGIRSRLERIHDLERLAGKVASGRITPRELLSLGRSLALLPELREVAEGVEAPILKEVTLELDPMEKVAARIHEGISAEAPHSLQEGGVIRSGFRPSWTSCARHGTGRGISSPPCRPGSAAGPGSAPSGSASTGSSATTSR